MSSEGARFQFVLAVTSTCFILAGSLSPASAACTDADGDGYFREAGCGTAVDCNDAAANVHPGATEICDGVDNNCDGLVDNAAGCFTTCDPARLGPEVKVTSNPNDDLSPAVAWNGQGNGVTWVYDEVPCTAPCTPNEEIHFVLLDAWGAALGSQVRVTNAPGRSGEPVIAWTGTNYGVSWDDDRPDGKTPETFFIRLDAAGAPIGPELQVSDPMFPSESPALAWSGGHYGIVWEDRRDFLPLTPGEIYSQQMASNGTKIGGNVRDTNNSGDSFFPRVVWTGSQYGVTWVDDRDGNWEIYFMRLSESGVKQGSDVRVTNDPAYSTHPDVTWTGSEFGVVWEDQRDGDHEIYFARLDATGAKIGADVRVTNSSGSSQSPSIVWSGSEYGLAWSDDKGVDRRSDVYFTRLDAAGNLLGSEIRVSSAPSQFDTNPRMAWTGSSYSIVWGDSRGPREIYFAPISCGCSGTDFDGDGVADCVDCNDRDGSVWSRPGEVPNLQFASDKATLTWNAPSDAGGVAPLVYDTLRSDDPSDFFSVGVCVETNDGSDTNASDPETPTSGSMFAYLVRAQNPCPAGEGSLGVDSTGAERTGRTCP